MYVIYTHTETCIHAMETPQYTSYIYPYIRSNLLLILAGGVAVDLPIQPVVRRELAFLGLLQRRLWRWERERVRIMRDICIYDDKLHCGDSTVR